MGNASGGHGHRVPGGGDIRLGPLRWAKGFASHRARSPSMSVMRGLSTPRVSPRGSLRVHTREAVTAALWLENVQLRRRLRTFDPARDTRKLSFRVQCPASSTPASPANPPSYHRCCGHQSRKMPSGLLRFPSLPQQKKVHLQNEMCGIADRLRYIHTHSQDTRTSCHALMGPDVDTSDENEGVRTS